MTYRYRYTGKPTDKLLVAERTWTELRFPKHDPFIPPFVGKLDAMLYLNVDARESGGGWVRVQVVREGSEPDESALQDYQLRPDRPTTLTHTWFEECEAWRPLHWEIYADQPVTLGTRYAKWCLIRKTV